MRIGDDVPCIALQLLSCPVRPESDPGPGAWSDCGNRRLALRRQSFLVSHSGRSVSSEPPESEAAQGMPYNIHNGLKRTAAHGTT